MTSNSKPNYVVVCCKYYSLGVGLQKSKQELDRLKKYLVDYPCYLCHNIMDSWLCQLSLLNNVVVGKGQSYAH